MPLLLLFFLLFSLLEYSQRKTLSRHTVCVWNLSWKKNQNSRNTMLILKIIIAYISKRRYERSSFFATVTKYFLRRCEYSHLELHERDFSTCSLFSIWTLPLLSLYRRRCRLWFHAKMNLVSFITTCIWIDLFFSFIRIALVWRAQDLLFCTIAHCFFFFWIALCHSNIVLLHVNTFDSC